MKILLEQGILIDLESLFGLGILFSEGPAPIGGCYCHVTKLVCNSSTPRTWPHYMPYILIPLASKAFLANKQRYQTSLEICYIISK